MQRITCLIAIIGAVWMGQAMGSPVAGDEILIEPHTQQAETLTRAQLVEKFSGLKFKGDHQGETAEYVAEQLYIAKAKDNTGLVNGVTVGELVEKNHVKLDDCTVKAFQDRSLIYLKTMPVMGGESGLVYGVSVYVLRLLRATAEYCTRHQEQVVTKGINQAAWLRDLSEAIERDAKLVRSSGPMVEEELVYNNDISEVAAFIEGGSDAAIKKMYNLGRKPSLGY